MFTGHSKKSRRNHQAWNDDRRPQRAALKYPLAPPPEPPDPHALPDHRIIVAWGDGCFPTVKGNPSAPQALKACKILGCVSRGTCISWST